MNKSPMYVITKTRDLAGYILNVTNKSPKNLRYSYVNKIQERALRALTFLVEANEYQIENREESLTRATFQKKAFIELKMLGYLSFLGCEAGAILDKQYQQIALQLDECCRLLKSWRKSDEEKVRV